MPIYEYRCDSCGFQKEFIQRMSDARLTQCPECKQETFNKMVTAAGFQLKGGGWYVTDFKNSGGNTGSAKKTEEKQTDTSGKSESAKSESKDSSASASSTSGSSGSSTTAASTPAASTAATPSSS
jgi:putative FmdB family regulatory protein